MAIILPWEIIDWIADFAGCGLIVLASVLLFKGIGKLIDIIRYKRNTGRWM